MTGVSLAAKIYGRIFGGGDVPLAVDSSGNALVRQASPASGVTIGALTASGQTVVCTTAAGYQEALITFSGTYGAFQFGVEVSDDGGATWFFAPIAQQVTTAAPLYPNDASTANISANATRLYRVPTYGLGQVRVRSNGGPGSGTCAVRITMVPFGTPHGATVAALAMDATKTFNLATPNTSQQVSPPFSTASNAQPLGVVPFMANSIATGTDAMRGMENIAALTSAARTATKTANLTMVQNCAILVVVDVTARASTTTLTPSLLMGNTTTVNVANKTIWTAAAAINT